MTRESAKSKVNRHQIDILNKADEVIDQIYNDHEAQLKAKDEEIDRVRTENRKYKEHITLKHLNEPIVFCANCSEKVIMLNDNK